MSKKIPLLIFCFIATICQNGYAQNNLQYGQNDADNLINRPNIYWDLLREDGYSWITQSRTQEDLPWKNLVKAVTQKNGDGKFTVLQNGEWLTNSQSWDINHNYSYIYTKNANGQLVELEDESLNPFTDEKRKFTFEYDAQGNLQKATILKKVGTVYQNFLIRYYFYTSNMRVSDSTISFTNGSYKPSSRAIYKYDGNKRCIQQVSFWPNQSGGWDTVQYQNYGYASNGKLTFFEDYTIDAVGTPPMPQFRNTFSYTALGKPNEVTTTYRNSTTNAFDAEPGTLYRHYYNTQGRLVAGSKLLKGTGNLGWMANDSIALKYLANGQMDTGYQYKASAGSWFSFPNYKLIFDINTTGIHTPVSHITGIKAYPNPANNVLIIEMETPKGGDFVFELTDIAGRKVKTIEAYNLQGGTQNMEITIEDVNTGIYFLNCGNKTIKIVKE